VIDDVRRCVTMDFKRPGSYLCLVSPAGGNDGLANLAALHRALSAAIRGGAVLACHDVSDGSLLVAAAEMAIASGRGVNLSAQMLQRGPFDERNGRYLVEVAERGGVEKLLETIGGPAGLDIVGRVSEEPVLRLAGESVAVDQLAAAWLGTLDW